MATLWISYAWADNKDGDVDFAAQELGRMGLKVKLDRWTVRAGLRLWDQIAEFIQSPAQCDAWLLYATQASLGSEPCREEFAYALERALSTRGSTFPVIGLFPATVDKQLIPPAIRTRLYVSLRDSDWKDRVVAAAEGRAPSIGQPAIQAFHLKLHRRGGVSVFEVRLRAGTWCPFVAGIPVSEESRVSPSVSYGAAGAPPKTSIVSRPLGLPQRDNEWAYVYANNEATPTMSYFIQCKEPPSKLLFGIRDGQCYVVSNPLRAGG